jgi:uncharacterized protein (DUF1800 family)
MEPLKAPLALALCYCIGFPAPLGLAQQATASADQTIAPTTHRQKYHSAQIQGDERILHALNRFTFGPKPGDLEAVRAVGLEKWFDRQLQPASIDENDLNSRLTQYPAMQWTPEDLLYRAPNPAIIRQAMNGKGNIPEQGTLHAVYENQIYRLQLKKEGLAQKKAEQASAAMSQASSAPGENPSPVSESRPGAPAMVMNGAANDAPGGQATGAMATNSDASMAPAERAATNEAGAEMGQPEQMSAGQKNSGQMNAGQANPMTADTAAGAPAVDPEKIRAILALPPEQRVDRLSRMQPPEFEDFMKSLKGPRRQAMMADLSPELRECVLDLENPRQMVVSELFAQRLTRDVYSNAQLQAVMADFWFNHFNVYVAKDEPEPYYLVSYERDVIRPHALGKFEDLLEAVAHSPAMLLYLDNAQSVGPDSFFALKAKENDFRRPKEKRQAPQGLNENYARELMELHTLGVNGGYTQADVTQVARILTGWTIDRPQQGGGFMFNPMRHEPGTKVVMRQKFKEKGEMEGRELLHFLATRPATAQFISRKLAIRFVSDDPPQSLVDHMAKSYLASGGDISTVLSTLFHSPEFWAASNYRAKIKTPLEYVVSAARASNANIENMQPLVAALRQMGMPLYGAVPPTGYKWDAADWVSTGALVDRMNFALSLAANRLPGVTVEWAPELDMSSLDDEATPTQVVPTPETEEARLEPLLVAGGVSDATRAAALKEFEEQSAQSGTLGHAASMTNSTPVSEARPGAPATPRRNNRAPAADAYERQDQLLAGLLLGSPEFQRR